MQSEEARAAELRSALRTIERDALRRTGIALGTCVLSCVAGLALVGWAIHTTDDRWAGVAFWGGLLIGDGGMFATLLWYFADSDKYDA